MTVTASEDESTLGTMKKSLVSLIVLSLAVAVPTQATAATKQSKFQQVNKTFQALLTDGNDAIDALEAEYEKNIDALDAALLAATQAAEVASLNEILASTTLYTPQIAASTKKIEDAKANFSGVAKVKVLSASLVGSTRINQYLKCPADTVQPGGAGTGDLAVNYCSNDGTYPRPGDKSKKVIGATVGGYDWQKGDFTEIVIWSVSQCIGISNCGGTEALDNAVAEGAIQLLTPIDFETTRSTLKIETINLANLNTKYGEARKKAEATRSETVTRATSARQSQLDDLTEIYQDKKDSLEIQANIAEDAVAAAKRASKDPEIFDKAFTVAYKFEYNRRMLSELADTEWSGTWTYRTINSLAKIARLADTADSIAAKYSYKNASAFNSSIGIGFTGEPEFRATLKVVVAKYQKATGKRIAISA
jgi:hypothetical protein